jgi:hypothetical protein
MAPPCTSLDAYYSEGEFCPAHRADPAHCLGNSRQPLLHRAAFNTLFRSEEDTSQAFPISSSAETGGRALERGQPSFYQGVPEAPSVCCTAKKWSRKTITAGANSSRKRRSTNGCGPTPWIPKCLPVYGELLFGQSRVRRNDAKPECSSMKHVTRPPRMSLILKAL